MKERLTPPAALVRTTVEQPAAAALILRRQDLAKIGGFDEAFYPAWFEDVDLAFRMRSQGMTMRYCPAAQFTHHLGSSIPTLGYGPFLNAYYANLCRYLAKHHGRLWAGLARGLLVPAALLRIALLPLRRPSRVGSRREAVRGLWDLAVGAIKGWPPGFVDLPTAPVAAATGRDPR